MEVDEFLKNSPADTGLGAGSATGQCSSHAIGHGEGSGYGAGSRYGRGQGHGFGSGWGYDDCTGYGEARR